MSISMKGILVVHKSSIPIRQINIQCRKIILVENRLIAENEKCRVYMCTVPISPN